jgi:hypothetical protein
MTDSEKIEQLEKEVKKLNHVIDILISSNTICEAPTVSIQFGIYNVVERFYEKDSLAAVRKKLRESIDRISSEW